MPAQPALRSSWTSISSRLLMAVFACLAGGTGSSSLLGAEQTYDVVIYGGTSAGVSAAIQTRRMGRSVVLIEPGKYLGGLTVGGLGATDSGNKAVIGGISREFYQRVRRHYQKEGAWRQEQAAENASFGEKSDAMWTFEPHVAEQIIKGWLADEKVECVLGEALNRKNGVHKEGGQIVSIEMKSGKRFAGKRFIDATYEGDLLAAAGVSYTVGREANEKYGETLNGVQVANAIYHQFVKPVDPYVKPGDPASGLLPGINPHPPAADGTGDDHVQAYNYRICMTDAPENRVPFNKPDGYDPLEHELLLRNFEAGDMRIPLSIKMMPNRKTDLNNNFAVSTDWIGQNYEYAEANDETRAKILKDHETYVRGFLWTLTNHPRVPESVRKEAGRWGYSKDEFVENDYFPIWCYIREGRRMIGVYIQTELDCRRMRICDDSVGLGSYSMDSHHSQRYVDETGHVRNEGDVQVSPRGAYAISARSLLPKGEECSNLIVPVCLSCSHMAYGSIRMEPVFMILGQSAATMCCLSLDSNQSLHQLPYETLRAKLLADHQVLDLPHRDPARISKKAKDLPGIVIDDTQARRVGEWTVSHSSSDFIGEGYLHDGGSGNGQKQLVYTALIPSAGEYELRMSYPSGGNRATNVLVTCAHVGHAEQYTVNQREVPPIDKTFVSLGKVKLAAKEAVQVTISNEGANGHVIGDVIQFLPVEAPAGTSSQAQ